MAEHRTPAQEEIRARAAARGSASRGRAQRRGSSSHPARTLVIMLGCCRRHLAALATSGAAAAAAAAAQQVSEAALAEVDQAGAGVIERHVQQGHRLLRVAALLQQHAVCVEGRG